MSRYTLQPGMIVPQTPFYYCDIDLLQRTLQTATTEAARYGYQIHYAMKANAEPHILYEIQQAGLGADCVSGYEVECAIENGFHPSKIVFAGVGKSDREIEYAIRQGIFAFNCESLQELEVINELAGRLGKQVNVALRINPDVRPHTHHYISTGQSESKVRHLLCRNRCSLGRTARHEEHSHFRTAFSHRVTNPGIGIVRRTGRKGQRNRCMVHFERRGAPPSQHGRRSGDRL